MRFTWEAWDSRSPAPSSKQTGTYEFELHSTVEAIIPRAPRRIVEIGAAEGYYAIGFARRVSGAEIIAFDELASARRLMAQLAKANGVADRVAWLWFEPKAIGPSAGRK